MQTLVSLCSCFSAFSHITRCPILPVSPSALHGMGEIKYKKLLDSSQKLRSDVLIFCDAAAAKQSIQHVDEKIIQSIIGVERLH